MFPLNRYCSKLLNANVLGLCLCENTLVLKIPLLFVADSGTLPPNLDLSHSDSTQSALELGALSCKDGLMSCQSIRGRVRGKACVCQAILHEDDSDGLPRGYSRSLLLL